MPCCTLQEGWAAAGLAALFPAGAVAPAPSGKPPVGEHLATVAGWAALAALARQVAHEAAHAPSHKYLAHQLALLYQCLNACRGECKYFKRRIEGEFDAIKAATEAGPSRRLSPYQQAWCGLPSHSLVHVRCTPSCVAMEGR